MVLSVRTWESVEGHWFRILLLAGLYTVIELPLDIAFELPSIPWIVFDTMIVTIFALDIVVNFIAPFRNDEDEWVVDAKLIRRQYIRGWFLLDFLAAIPIDVIMSIQDLEAHSANGLSFSRLLKAFRLFRAFKVLDKIDIKGLPAWMQLWSLALMFFCVSHWCACGFFKVATLEGLQSSWLVEKRDLTHDSPFVQYTWCLYWALATLTTLGYGDIHPVTVNEVSFVIFVIGLGGACYAIIIAGVGGHVVSTRFAAKIDYTRFFDAVYAFERDYRLPMSLRKRLNDYYEFLWKRQYSFDDKEILKRLPHDLRVLVLDAVFTKLVDHVDVLGACADYGEEEGHAFLSKLRTILRWDAVVVPGRTLFVEGQPGTRVYFIRKGRVELRRRCELVGADLVVGVRGPWQYFGDMGNFPSFSDETSASPGERVHGVSAVAVDFIEAFSVPVEDLVDLLCEYPKIGRLFSAFASARTDLSRDLFESFTVDVVARNKRKERAMLVEAIKNTHDNLRAWLGAPVAEVASEWEEHWMEKTSLRVDDELFLTCLGEWSEASKSRDHRDEYDDENDYEEEEEETEEEDDPNASKRSRTSIAGLSDGGDPNASRRSRASIDLGSGGGGVSARSIKSLRRRETADDFDPVLVAKNKRERERARAEQEALDEVRDIFCTWPCCLRPSARVDPGEADAAGSPQQPVRRRRDSIGMEKARPQLPTMLMSPRPFLRAAATHLAGPVLESPDSPAYWHTLQARAFTTAPPSVAASKSVASATSKSMPVLNLPPPLEVLPVPTRTSAGTSGLFFAGIGGSSALGGAPLKSSDLESIDKRLERLERLVQGLDQSAIQTSLSRLESLLSRTTGPLPAARKSADPA